MKFKKHRQRWPLLVGAAVLSVTGLGLIGDGLWLKGKAVLAQHLLETAWADTRAGAQQAKPWPWADMWPAFQLEVPSAEVSLVVLEGASGEALAFAPGWMTSTPRPGDAGLSVIAAHRDTHFAFLEHARIGDQIWITKRDGKRAAFQIESTHVVDAHASGLDPGTDGKKLALVTCWPFNALEPGPLRFVAIAALVESPQLAPAEERKPLAPI